MTLTNQQLTEHILSDCRSKSLRQFERSCHHSTNNRIDACLCEALNLEKAKGDHKNRDKSSLAAHHRQNARRPGEWSGSCCRDAGRIPMTIKERAYERAINAPESFHVRIGTPPM